MSDTEQEDSAFLARQEAKMGARLRCLDPANETVNEIEEALVRVTGLATQLRESEAREVALREALETWSICSDPNCDGEGVTWHHNWSTAEQVVEQCRSCDVRHRALTQPAPPVVSRALADGLRSLLREVCWWTAGRMGFDRQGYSLDVREETAIRDVNYRDYPLYATADEAIDAGLAEMKEATK